MNLSRSALNFSSPSGPLNDSLKPKKAKITSAPVACQPFVGRAEILGTMPPGDLVARTARLRNDQIELRMPRDNICLEIPGMLKPFRQRAAEQRDVVVLFEGELRLGLRA